MIRKVLLLLAVALVAVCCNKGPDDEKSENGEKKGPLEAEVGQTLPDWAEGYLDIHAISTGRGECTFFIMPDGTSMAVDAGEVITSKSSPVSVTQRPNSTTRPYFTQSRYMKHFLEATGHNRLDYFNLSHFHSDHMGTPSDYFTMSSAGYAMCGMFALYMTLPFDRLIDRIYSKDDPDYEQLEATTNVASISDGTREHYSNFVKYAVGKGLKVERFDIGSSEQIGLVHKASSYPDFKVMNYAANGEYWNGTKVADAYGTALPNENGNCCIFLMSYGKFDYYTGGDAGGNTKMADPVAKVINRPIEAMKADHHMSVNCMTPAQMGILKPKVIVTQSFAQRTDQPMLETVSALLDGSYYDTGVSLYFTNIDPVIYTPNQALYGRSHYNGHVVIRVVPGGGQFYVYQLDDTNNFYKVKSIEGPFTCE